MESKIIKYKDTDFTFVYDPSLIKKKKNRLLKKYFSLEKEFLGDIDKSLIESYENRIAELETAIETTKDEKHKAELQIKLDKAKNDFETDSKVKSIQKEIAQCTGLLMTELCEDTEFMKPFLKEVLQGDISIIEFGSQDALVFIMEVINNFFSFTVSSN